ncbi:MAG: TIM barrel protein [Clostridiales bacterium]|jgi:deoxyribonuclease-4|nr:TIM barrel protein [Clostridiales bacterium]
MTENRTVFGPAGNGDEFYAAGMKATIQAPGYLQGKGLDAYEYQCGRGVRISEDAAAALGEKGRVHGVRLSVHAPYYISLASNDEEKRLNSVKYITDSGRAVWGMGGSHIVVHPGGLNKRTRADAAALACDTLRLAQQALDEQGLEGVHICPETMGKINQLGDLDEVLLFCGVDERFLPCVDFGHLNSRTLGGVNTPEAFAAVLDAVENAVGMERARQMHIHFSKIEYSAGGEKMHLTFADTKFGPEPAPLMELLARRGYAAAVICESAGTQVSDAAHMKQLYEGALGDE